MAENKELKPKSFRIDEDTAERVKQITAEIGGNQQEAIAKMIEAYEFQKGKAVLTERKADIERFESYSNILVRMFMSVLEDNQNIGETIKTEFAAQFNAKDTTIRDLQEKCGGLLSDRDAAVLQAEKLRELHASTEEQLGKVRAELKEKESQYSSMLTDKESLNKALLSTVGELKGKVESMADEVNRAKDTEARLSESEKRNVAAERDIESLKKQLLEAQDAANKSIESALQATAFEHEKVVLGLEKEHQAALQKIEQNKRVEIDEYQKKYLSLLERIKEQEFAHVDKGKKAAKGDVLKGKTDEK